jgi:hypothetical protein
MTDLTAETGGFSAEQLALLQARLQRLRLVVGRAAGIELVEEPELLLLERQRGAVASPASPPLHA